MAISFGETIGILGMYIAIMLILAIATERIVILLKKWSKLGLQKVVETPPEEMSSVERKKERERMERITICTIIVGILVATFTQVDTFELLNPLWNGAGNLAWPWSVDEGSKLLSYYYHWVGIVLSGVGASMGSRFWHDCLDTLTKVKQAKSEVDKAKAGIIELRSVGTEDFNKMLEKLDRIEEQLKSDP